MTAATSTLQAGAARIDITPRRGTQLGGDIGRRRPAELVIDPLYARALVLAAGDRKLCIVSLDLIAVTPECANAIRRQAERILGCPTEAVMVHDTQNHAAPALGHFMVSDRTGYIPPELSWLRGGDDAYEPYATERILQAITAANAALEPVRMGTASGIESRVAFNRRFVMRDGTTNTHPVAGNPLIRHVEGPMDPELGVVCFVTESLQTVAMLLHHTCHPCHGYPHRYVIADWPGVWCEEIEKTYRGAVPLVINGCCGNIHHQNHLDPTQVDDYRNMGQVLAESTRMVMQGITLQDTTRLEARTASVKVALREPDPEAVRQAREFMARYPEPKWQDAAHTSVDWEWFFAVALLDHVGRREREPEIDLEIQAFRIGDAVIVGLPGEPFVEGQLRLKLESPAYPTYVAHHCGAPVNYIPTPQAFVGGGYEVQSCHAARLVPEALDMLVNGAVGLVKEMFAAA